MYATLPGHLSTALIFAGAFVVALVLVTELARAARLVELALRRSRFWRGSARLTTVAGKDRQSDSAPA